MANAKKRGLSGFRKEKFPRSNPTKSLVIPQRTHSFPKAILAEQPPFPDRWTKLIAIARKANDARSVLFTIR